ncbi:MAG: hypothetical protein CMI00_08975 [Oceanospirillaceae bacterium]|nr:hypothetical protein [Oceanospirillaceae bacterium]|tara:strand:- start:3979 stop:4830 length:852 start_codon:yes stop_codon:yes gene_type:complete
MKRLILVTLGIAAPLAASADMVSLSERSLTEVTAQDGVNINLDVNVSVGEIRYIDTAENGDGDGGGLSINDITLTGANKTDFFGNASVITDPSSNIDNISIQVDTFENDRVTIYVTPLVDQYVDFQVTTGPVNIVDIDGNTSVNLINSLSLTGLLGSMYAEILEENSDGQRTAAQINLELQFAIEDLDIDASSLGIRINNAFVCGSECIESMRANGGRVDMSDAMVNIAGVIKTETNKAIIDLEPFVIDAGIGSLIIGGGNVGSFMFDDISLGNSVTTISGKE